VKIFHNTSDHIVATQKKNVWSLQFEHFTILRVCEKFQIQADWVTFHEATRLERRISYLKQSVSEMDLFKKKVFFLLSILQKSILCHFVCFDLILLFIFLLSFCGIMLEAKQ
jgi:hypothetical protein